MRRLLRLRPVALRGALVLLVIGVAGCGRRGALEPAPDPSVTAPAAATGATLQPMEPRARHVPIKPPHEPFVLDPLL